MKSGTTNFAYLMDLLGVKAAEMSRVVGADKTLVSRWRTGGRRLMPTHHWADKLADYFLEVDAGLAQPVLQDVLRAYYPGEAMDTPGQRKALLTHWMTHTGQKEAEYQRHRAGLFDDLLEKIKSMGVDNAKETPARPAPAPGSAAENAIAYGGQGVQASALRFLDLVNRQPGPQQIWYACPEGLEIYTRDEAFGTQLMNRLMDTFAAGHTLNVVLRTDYKMTDVSAFSGRWLVAHLQGYVKSHYFDEFHKNYQDKMLVALRGKMAMRVMGTDRQGEEQLYTSIHFDTETVDSVWYEIEGYYRRSKQRFHYGFFEQPDGFLAQSRPMTDRAHYQFARLPHFCLVPPAVFQRDFSLTDEEMTLFTREFGPLLITPENFEGMAPLRHVFCEDAIEDALLKKRHTCFSLTAITGRRVMMTTRLLVQHLLEIKRLLLAPNNYEVSFLPTSVFEKLTMQIACWGDTAAIGWVPGGKSTACRDYTNVNALTGFCEAIWDKIPGPMKQRRAALQKLNVWLKKAQKYGYDVG